MTINSIDGQFCLDMWEDPDRQDVEALSEYSDNLEVLKQRAQVVFAAGRFKWLELSRWIGPGEDDWQEIDTYTRSH